MQPTHPILYSYRRCPYAMRARMALKQAHIDCLIKSISLKNKPSDLLQCSPKGTVPVLKFPDGKVIDESLEIMFYALKQHDPDHWMPEQAKMDETIKLIQFNDTQFKQALDCCKYASRHSKTDAQQAMTTLHDILSDWNQLIKTQNYFHGSHLGLADIALLPFVRQCLKIKPDITHNLEINALKAWSSQIETSSLFTFIMDKKNN